MILAVIDVGTNSVKLLVAHAGGGRITPRLPQSRITRLGAGLQHTGRISPAAARRTLAAVSSFRKAAEGLGAKELRAVGTRALRASKNAVDFLGRCRRAGVALRILSGAEEARLGFLSASSAARRPRLVSIDIGGGSTQITSGRRGRPSRKWSFPIGAVTLTERFVKSDPPRPEELRAMAAEVRRRLKPVDICAGRGTELVGIGGTVSALALLSDLRGAPGSCAGRVSVRSISATTDELARLTLARRLQRGLERGRADIIVAGAVILREAMARLQAKMLLVCPLGIRHAVLIEMASRRGR